MKNGVNDSVRTVFERRISLIRAGKLPLVPLCGTAVCRDRKGGFGVRLVDVFVGCFLSGSDELKASELSKASPNLTASPELSLKGAELNKASPERPPNLRGEGKISLLHGWNTRCGIF